MTYLGYFALGPNVPDPGTPPVFELVNSGRAFAYGEGLAWLDACDDCLDVDEIFGVPDGYVSIEADPAPWYSDTDADSLDFIGVVGLDATGIDDSTATAPIYQSAGIGGVAGALRFNTRTMVFRVLAIGRNECGLAYGINWLRNLYQLELNICDGDGFYFFDCCPNCGVEPGTESWCWPADYDALGDPADPFTPNLYPANTCPTVPPTWWPVTYQDLADGPPVSNTYWCNWPENYRRLTIGPPTYNCDAGTCVLPYVRQFRNTRIIGGPTILQKNVMSDNSVIAQIEFVVVAADPTHYSVQTNLPVGQEGPTVNTMANILA